MPLRWVILPHWKLRAGIVELFPKQNPKRRSRRDRFWNDVVGANTDRAFESDINWVIMDYLVSEGYPGAAEKFAQETNLPTPVDNESIRERVQIRNAIHGGRVDEAIEMVNEIDPEVSLSAYCAPT